MSKLAYKMYYQCLRKKIIRTPEHAKEVAENISKRTGKEITYYLCPFCLNYHLTSHPKDKGDHNGET